MRFAQHQAAPWGNTLADYIARVQAEEAAASEFDYRAVACVAPELADWLDPSCALRDAGLMILNDH
jgi:hypothetical protein